MYDLTNQATFDNLQDWWETVKNSFKGKEHDKMPHFALVANKGVFRNYFKSTGYSGIQ